MLKEIEYIPNVSCLKGVGNSLYYQREKQLFHWPEIEGLIFENVQLDCFFINEKIVVYNDCDNKIFVYRGREKILEIENHNVFADTIDQNGAYFSYERELKQVESSSGFRLSYRVKFIPFVSESKIKGGNIPELIDHVVFSASENIVVSGLLDKRDFRSHTEVVGFTKDSMVKMWTRPFSSFNLGGAERKESGRIRFLGVYKKHVYIIILNTIVKIDINTGETIQYWRELGEKTVTIRESTDIKIIPMAYGSIFFDRLEGKIRGFSWPAIYWEINLESDDLSIFNQEKQFLLNKVTVYGGCKSYRGKYAYIKSDYYDSNGTYPSIAKYDTEKMEFVDIYRFEDETVKPQRVVVSDRYIGVLSGRLPTLLYDFRIFDDQLF